MVPGLDVSVAVVELVGGAPGGGDTALRVKAEASYVAGFPVPFTSVLLVAS